MGLHVHADAFASATFAAASAIRQRVFLAAYGLAPALDTDEQDAAPSTVHFVGRDDELQRPVAAARAVWLPHARTAQLARIAVLPEARGRGHGQAIVAFAVAYLRASTTMDVERIVLFCPREKCAFYEKCGFSQTHKSELVRHLTLYEMELVL